MKALRRFLDSFRDSPTYGRDRANLISGFTIGTASLILNGAVLMLVAPLMASPDDRMFRTITDNMEFGQLLALILLGGATLFATLLIPLRLVTVFWEPRIGRYFDQVVLSGISPLRFVIGKATSQNLFLALSLFLLVPYLVLSLTLGGVDLGVFLAGLFLVWLYCMTLALVMLWVSLYLNELLAALVVISAAGMASMFGCCPFPVQPFVMTPFPALVYPLYASIPELDGTVSQRFLPVFFACAGCMAGLSGLALFGIALGPLYGIIRENSTFGEVVRDGDSKRKRWFRMRLHIQRSSEMAFFYENRSQVFLRNEGLLRWGLSSCGLAALSFAAYAVEIYTTTQFVRLATPTGRPWWVLPFHCTTLTIHGVGLALAAILFSHAKNTTYLRLPFLLGRKVEVSKLDTVAFLMFLTLSTAGSIATPYVFDQINAGLTGYSIFPDRVDLGWRQANTIDLVRIAVEGTAIISVAGLTIYAFQRYLCLLTWLRSVTFVSLAVLYMIFVCLLPALIAVALLEIHEFRSFEPIAVHAPKIAAISPSMVIYYLLNGELGRPFPNDISTAPFYVVHIFALGLTLWALHRQGKKLRQAYLTAPVERDGNG